MTASAASQHGQLPAWLGKMDPDTRARVVHLLRLAARVLREEEVVRGH